jgi:GNAT superfamily N-acetyltransferase
MKNQNYDYIVSFYLRERRSFNYSENTQKDKFFLLKRHLKFLEENTLKGLNQVYFVFNIDYVERFDQNLVKEITNKYDVNVNLIFRENKGLSYGAWNHTLIENLKAKRQAKYTFLCEDDYIPTNSNFALPFLKKFQEKPNIGYVAQLVLGIGHDNTRHAAISNGFIDCELAQKIYETHNKLFAIKDLSPRENNPYNTGVHNQVHFLDNFTKENYTIEDISEDYCQPFYELRVEDIELYGNEDGEILIEPILSPLFLTPLTKKDLPFLLEVRNDKTTRKFLGNNSKFTLKECEKWFENLEAKWFIINYENKPVGYMRTTPNGEVGLDIHPKHRRNGYARLAYKEYLKYKRFATLWVFEDNFAKSLYEELGFKPTGNIGEIRKRKYIQMFYYNPNKMNQSTEAKPVKEKKIIPNNTHVRRAQR